MWVQSQDKRTLANCYRFLIRKNYGGTNDPGFVLDGIDSRTLFGEHTVHLGYFYSEANAVLELSKLLEAINQGKAIYQIRELDPVQPNPNNPQPREGGSNAFIK